MFFSNSTGLTLFFRTISVLPKILTMKYFLFSSLLFLSFSLFSQSAPAVEGDLIRSGELVFKGEITGHYRITDNQRPGENIYIYTLALLGNDLQPLGSKVYKSEEALMFEAVAYNGAFLGVMFKGKEKGGSRFVDILDGTGQRISRVKLEVKEDARGSTGLFLVPTKEGFISCVAITNKQKMVGFDLSLLPSDGASEGWHFFSKEHTINGSNLPRLVAVNADRMVIAVKRTRGSQIVKYAQDIYCLDVKTGELIYKKEAEKSTNSSYTMKRVLSGALTGGKVLMAREITNFFKPKKNGFELQMLDEEGSLIISKIYSSNALFEKALTENKLPALNTDADAVQVALQISSEGVTTVAFEVSATKGIGSVGSCDYREGYVVAISPDFELGPMIKIEKKHFSLPLRAVDGLTSYEIEKFQKRLSKGQFDKLKLYELVVLHDGPYGYTSSINGADFISYCFMDRVFTSGLVINYGIRIATYIDGEFELDYIPLEDNPDFISISRAKEGYLKLTEYKYGEGAVKVWLERLNY